MEWTHGEREREEWASQSVPLGRREAAAARRSKQTEVKHETPESPLLLLSHYPIEWRRGDSFSFSSVHARATLCMNNVQNRLLKSPRSEISHRES